MSHSSSKEPLKARCRNDPTKKDIFFCVVNIDRCTLALRATGTFCRCGEKGVFWSEREGDD
ncbi:MAG TPA: hypothetical protein DCE42_05450 [Myxococcales bacterium]|nr:hypothetical protein [Deltaproteobacteria bacterium]MBU48887.1 hypothetical protein [Deltaproteobacteria bacterium]HAA54178.1 hypothetical protein [Myxococcales bacterium]